MTKQKHRTLKDPIIENARHERVILVLEDERPLMNAIKLKLEKNGFEVVSARSVTQALSYLEDIPELDAVWLDHYVLGKEDGLVFVAKLKSDNHGVWKDVPLFVVSNTAGEEKVKAYMHLGVNKYFVKAEHRLDEIVDNVKFCLDNPGKCKVL